MQSYARPRPLAADHGSEMLTALLRGDTLRANTLADDLLDAGMSRSQLIDEVIAPALREVGQRWADAEVSLIQEHLATSTAESIVMRLRSRLPSERPAWLVTTVQGEQHRVGAAMAAACLSELGEAVEVCEALTAEAIAAAAPGRPGVCIACAGPWSIAIARDAAARTAATGVPVLLGGPGWGSWEQAPEIRLVRSMDALAGHLERLRS